MLFQNVIKSTKNEMDSQYVMHNKKSILGNEDI